MVSVDAHNVLHMRTHCSLEPSLDRVGCLHGPWFAVLRKVRLESLGRGGPKVLPVVRGSSFFHMHGLQGIQLLRFTLRYGSSALTCFLSLNVYRFTVHLRRFRFRFSLRSSFRSAILGAYTIHTL